MIFFKKLHKKMGSSIQAIQQFTDRIWYPPLIGILAALDNVIVIIPNDGILISSSMLIPNRWFVLALSVTIGSTLGALALAMLVEFQGLPWILEIYPGVTETKAWEYSVKFFEKHGLLLVFAVAITPFLQQPAVILASLANTPLIELAAVIFTGRFLKFLAMAYLGSHAPRFLGRIWGLKDELKEVGIKIK